MWKGYALPAEGTAPVSAGGHGSRVDEVVSEIAKAVHEAREYADRGLSRSLIKQFAAGMLKLADHPVDHAIAAAMGMELWSKVLDLHSISLRQLIQLTSSGSSTRVEHVGIFLGGILYLFIYTDALKAGTDLGARLALGLLRTDSFQCYASLAAAWTGLSPDSLKPKLRLMAHFSHIFSSIAQLTVSDQPPTFDDRTGTVLYEACLRALGDSLVLEHISKVVLHARRTAAGDLVLDTIVKKLLMAVQSIVSKQDMLGPLRTAPTEEPEAPPEADVGQRLLPLARASLSTPCLQYLLGRELVAVRLLVTGGEGPKCELPDSLLPKPGNLHNPVPDLLTSHLLSRLRAATAVWHLLLVDSPQPGQQAGLAELHAPQPRAPPAIPFRPMNLFDMVLEALLCVVEPSNPVGFLPGGSQLTLVEPAMLLVRLAPRLRPGQLRDRLPRLWQALVKLMMRREVQLQYEEHRSLQLIGGLLRWDLLGACEEQGAEPACDAGSRSFSLRCAMDAGFLRAVEHLLRRWARADTGSGGEASCLWVVHNLLLSPCLWPAVLAHGSVREVASLIITLRKLDQVFKDRGRQAMSQAGITNEPNEHQDAEVVVTAYMVALLEQLAVVLLPASGDSRPLALNEALESGGQASFDGVVDQLGGRPASGTAQAAQQRTLAVFALSQWLPNAVWLARVVDTWFSVDMDKAVLRWVLEAALQCLVARDRSEAERALEAPQGLHARAHKAWTSLLAVDMDMLGWTHKFLEAWVQRVRPAVEADTHSDGVLLSRDSEAGGQMGQRHRAEVPPSQLLPQVLDVLEVLALALPRSMRVCVMEGGEPRADGAAGSPADRRPPPIAHDCGVIMLDEWLANALLSENRGLLLEMLQLRAKEDSRSGVAQSSAMATSLGVPALHVRELWLKHSLAALPELPSPYAAAEAVEAAGIQLCANPDCNNLEGDSEAELSGRKTCSRCKSVSYCSGSCQLKHWMSQHKEECQGMAAAAAAAAGAAAAAAAAGQASAVGKGMGKP